MYILPETELIKISSSKTAGDDNSATFVIEPLSPGYGITIGNALRRVMLASLEGSAVSSVKIKGVSHEFSTVENMREDVVEFILNLKNLPVRLYSDDPATIILEAKGAKEVTAADIKPNSKVEIIDPSYVLAHIEKGGSLKAEIVIEKGRGFVASEKKIEGKAPLGTIMLDSVFTPIKKVHYVVENTRVGSMTNFDKLTLDITTNGSITPFDAVTSASQIITDHLSLINSEIGASIKIKKGKTPKKKVVKAPKKTTRK